MGHVDDAPFHDPLWSVSNKRTAIPLPGPDMTEGVHRHAVGKPLLRWDANENSLVRDRPTLLRRNQIGKYSVQRSP